MNEWMNEWINGKFIQAQNNVYNANFNIYNLIVNYQTWFLHNVVSFRLRIKGKTSNWLSLSFTLPLLVEDTLT